MGNRIEIGAETANLRQWLMQLCDFYCKDILATPDAILVASPGGIARSPQAFTIECMSSCEWAIKALEGDDAPGDDDPTTMPAESYEAILKETQNAQGLAERLRAICERLSAAMLATSTERFNTVVTAPFGVDMPISAICNMFVNHLWYHDGQLNLIQALNGDETVHWM
jgi:hypothetical protein